MEIAEAAASEGKAFCIIRVDVGADTTAVREAVLKVMDQKVSLFLFLRFNFTFVLLSKCDGSCQLGRCPLPCSD